MIVRLTLFLLSLMMPSVVSAELIYQCTDAHHAVIYSNKELRGYTCVAPSLPELSVVPQYPQATITPRTPGTLTPSSYQDEEIPLVDAGKQTYALNPQLGNNVASQICDLYGKWLDLNLATRGGLYYSNLTAPLITLFGGGYIPMECRR